MHSTLLWYLDDTNGDKSGSTIIDGVPMEYILKGNTMYASRLLSTDPRHYLDSRFVPGTRLSGRKETRN